MFQAAVAGLKPAEFWALTPRELETYLRGFNERLELERDFLAEQTLPLVNVHVPRGKPKVSMRHLRPKRGKKKLEEAEDIESGVAEVLGGVSMREKVEIARRRWDAKEERVYWKSDEGRRLRAVIAGDEE